MALIPYPNLDEMDPEEREAIESFQREHGRHGLVRDMAAHYPPALRAVGLDDSMIVEAMAICMMSAWTNTFADALKFDEDLETYGMRERYF